MLWQSLAWMELLQRWWITRRHSKHGPVKPTGIHAYTLKEQKQREEHPALHLAPPREKEKSGRCISPASKKWKTSSLKRKCKTSKKEQEAWESYRPFCSKITKSRVLSDYDVLAFWLTYSLSTMTVLWIHTNTLFSLLMYLLSSYFSLLSLRPSSVFLDFTGQSSKNPCQS